jgi:hypothetical protein
MEYDYNYIIKDFHLGVRVSSSKLLLNSEDLISNNDNAINIHIIINLLLFFKGVIVFWWMSYRRSKHAVSCVRWTSRPTAKHGVDIILRREFQLTQVCNGRHV